jgi:1A family penicillin-binding protein
MSADEEKKGSGSGEPLRDPVDVTARTRVDETPDPEDDLEADLHPDLEESTSGLLDVTAGEAATPDAKAAAEAPPDATDGKKPKKKKKRKRFSVLRFLLLLILMGGGAAAALGYWGYRQFEQDLPRDLRAIHLYQPPRASRVYSADGELIGEFFLQKRIMVPIERIPKPVVNAFVAAEDSRYFKHGGVDPVGIARAAIKNYRAGRVVQGASTITQQVARLILLSPERTTQRKIREVILARRIEKELTKEQILNIYLNHVYLGHGAYGVQAAAEIYFGKDVQDLSLAEGAMLAGLPKAPTSDSPYARFQRARNRQSYVLDRLVEEKYATAAEAAQAREEPIALIQRESSRSHVAAPYFSEYVRRHLIKKFGAEELFAHGVNVHTTLDMRAQRAAEAAVLQGLEELDRKLPYRGPVGHLDGEERTKFLAARRPYAGQVKVTADDLTEAPHLAPASQPASQSQPAEEVVGRNPDLDLELPYLALVTGLKKSRDGEYRKVEVSVGDLTVPLTDVDAARALRWKADPELPGQPPASAPASSPAARRGKPGSQPTPSARAQKAARAKATVARVEAARAAKATKAAAIKAAVKAGIPERRLALGDLVAVRLSEQWVRGFKRETVVIPPRGKKGKARTVQRRRPINNVRYQASLAQRPSVQAALLSVDPHTGHVQAMVGGYDYQLSQFNRAVQAKRQIGSAIKPFIYGAAMDKGLTELQVIYDAPVVFKTATGSWSPRNYDGGYNGAMTLKMAIAKSINTISAQLVGRVGVDHVIDFMRRVGIKSQVPRHISIGVGTPDFSLWEVCFAQSAFANGGMKVNPVFVVKVQSRDGKTIEDHSAERPNERAIPAEVAYLVTDLMKGVVEYGTGKKARELGRPVAGKTGTSTGFRDAWFIGYTTDWLTGVWVGRDDFKPIAHNVTGGQFALPIWLRYMEAAHPPGPPRDFAAPPGIYFVRAMPETGLLVPPGTPGSVMVPFRRGTMPSTHVAGPTPKPGQRPEEPSFEDVQF